jgi:hypothetical protein
VVVSRLRVAVSHLRVAVIPQAVAVIPQAVAVIPQAVAVIHREAEDIRLEVAVTLCGQRSQAAVGLYLYRRAKRDMMSVLRQTSLI